MMNLSIYMPERLICGCVQQIRIAKAIKHDAGSRSLSPNQVGFSVPELRTWTHQVRSEIDHQSLNTLIDLAWVGRVKAQV